MLYIHKMSCISPQQTFGEINLEELKVSSGNMLHAIEPSYKGIPPGQLRRMGKAVRLGVGAALPLMDEAAELDGIIIGTANGGMEDCIKFLNQIIEYDEGTLTPTNFVQSTSNAIAAQIAFMNSNKGYNITHVHRGLSFENALLDALMHSMEHPEKKYLLGGLDEISNYNFNIDFLIGCFKKEFTANDNLYGHDSDGTIAGEGAAMFIISGDSSNALAAVRSIKTLHSWDPDDIRKGLNDFLQEADINIDKIDLLISGENGDKRYTKYSNIVEENISYTIPVIRYKHAVGEFPSATAIAVWLAVHFLNSGRVPGHMQKNGKVEKLPDSILIYNCYQGLQHSFILIQRAG